MKCFAEVTWDMVNDNDLVYLKGTENGEFKAYGPHRVDSHLCHRLRNNDGRSFINHDATLMVELPEAK